MKVSHSMLDPKADKCRRIASDEQVQYTRRPPQIEQVGDSELPENIDM